MTLFITANAISKEYNELTFSEDDIKHKAYQNMIGSGFQWKERGKIQLDFMVAAGLKPYHVFIDIGCGPLRAGEYFINYLNPSCYIGFDYSQGYIDVAQFIINHDNALKAKKPLVIRCDLFDLMNRYPHPLADFGLAFSVLNQCQREYVQAFFDHMGKSFKPGAKIYVMNDNMKWYPKWLPHSDLMVTQTYQDLDAFGISVQERLGRASYQIINRNDKFLIELTKQ